MEVYKVTKDDWCPSYYLEDGTMLVRVKLVPHKLSDGNYRVCVWGADDLGMELDHEDEKYVYAIFRTIIALDSISMEQLQDMGFVSA